MMVTVIPPTPSLGILTPTALPRRYQQQAKTLIPSFYSFISPLSSPAQTPSLHYALKSLLHNLENEKWSWKNQAP